MAGDHAAELEGVVGWKKTFNTITPRGRLHVAYASIALWSSLFMAIKFWPSKSREPKAITQPNSNK